MSFITDVYYKPPANPAKEAAITDRMIFFGGRLDLREDLAAGQEIDRKLPAGSYLHLGSNLAVGFVIDHLSRSIR